MKYLIQDYREGQRQRKYWAWSSSLTKWHFQYWGQDHPLVSEWSKSAVPVSCAVCFVAASWSGVMTNLFSLICYKTIKTHVDTQKNTMTGDNRALSKQLSMLLPGGVILMLHKGPRYHLSSCSRSGVASGSLTCPGLLGVPLVPQQAQQQKKDKFPPWVSSILPLWCWDTSCSLELCPSLEKHQPLRFPFWQVHRKYMNYFLALPLVSNRAFYLAIPCFSSSQQTFLQLLLSRNHISAPDSGKQATAMRMVWVNMFPT